MCGGVLSKKYPPNKLPKIPPDAAAMNAYDWRPTIPFFWPYSATRASFATSVIDAPRLLRSTHAMRFGRALAATGNNANGPQDKICRKTEKFDLCENF